MFGRHIHQRVERQRHPRAGPGQSPAPEPLIIGRHERRCQSQPVSNQDRHHRVGRREENLDQVGSLALAGWIEGDGQEDA